MGPLAAYIFSAMILWIPTSNHTFTGEPVTQITARYEEIAEAVEKVALDPNRTPLFSGDDGRIKTALLLASIASFESQYGRDVVNCKRAGDNGLAWGPWQTHSGKKRTCSSLEVAAGIAYDMIKYSFDHCQRVGLADKLTIYTSGGLCTHERGQASRFRMNRALYWFNKHQKHMTDLVLKHE